MDETAEGKNNNPMIEIQTATELPQQYAYRAFVVHDDQEAELLAGSATAYYRRSRKILYIPIGLVGVVQHDNVESNIPGRGRSRPPGQG